MPKVAVLLTQDDAGNVDAEVAFDPPLVPGMELPRVHATAFKIFKGTALEPAVRAAATALYSGDEEE